MKVLYLSLSVIILDQITKLIVKGFAIPFLNIYHKGMEYGEKIPIIGDFFRITFIENPGMAFGYDPGSSFKLWISLFSLIAGIGLLLYLYKVREGKLSLRIALAFILAGAVGNLIDRMFYGILYNYAPMFYGYVVDFIDVDFFNVSFLGRSYDRFPIFNIADASVTIGVAILLLFYRHHEEPEKELVTEGNNASSEIQDNTITADETNIKDEDVNPKDDQSDKGKEIPL
ncbi:MAG: signal peptidase II [Syntrophothermus sp.]